MNGSGRTCFQVSVEWQELCRDAQIPVRGNEIYVSCGPSRNQRVYVDDTDPEIVRLWSVVMLRGAAGHPHQVALESEKMNRFRELVRFKTAEYGGIIGECWVPMIDISANEWRTYVTIVAQACDRLECLSTGHNIES